MSSNLAKNVNRLGIGWMVLLGACGSSEEPSSPTPSQTPKTSPPADAVADKPGETNQAADRPSDASIGFADRFERPALSAEKARAVIASLEGTWVNDTGLDRKTWIIRNGQVTERVSRRGIKGDRGRTRRFRIEATRPGRLEVLDGERRSYYFLRKGSAFFASPTLGIFPMKSRRHFDVLDTAGNLIEYRDGRCTVRSPSGASKPVRCQYNVSYYHKVFMARYKLPSSGAHTVAVFHGEKGHLLHEQLLSCCKFKRTGR